MPRPRSCQEAAKKQRASLASQQSEHISMLHRPWDKRTSVLPASTCPGCGATVHPAGQSQCLAYGQTCFHCQKIGHFAKVCRSRNLRHNPTPTQAPANTPTVRHLTISNIQSIKTERAPLVKVGIASANGSSELEVLPDSGADISAAGKEILQHLNKRIKCLSPSVVIPRAVNGTKLYPLGKIPVHLQLGVHESDDELHIYPNILGALISWKACKGLGILSDHYPKPIPHHKEVNQPTKLTPSNLSSTPSPLTFDNLLKEFPSVFDEKIRTITGEEFHISLTKDAKLFCVNTPCSIPFAYRDKLKAELELLQQQEIIAPITEATEWCAQ